MPTDMYVGAGSGRNMAVVADLGSAPTSGTITLPLRLWWSTSKPLCLDIGLRPSRKRLYEIVLLEGTEADVVRYIDRAGLIDLWPDLFLPIRLRAAWETAVPQLRRPTC